MSRKSDRNYDARDERIAFLESELRKSETKWQRVLEHAPQIGISLDLDGNILFANQHFLDLTGWEFEDIRGRSWFDLFLPEDSRDAVRDVFLKTMQSNDVGPHSYYQNPIVTRDGTIRHVSWVNVQNWDREGRVTNVTCLGVDQTAEEEAKAALRSSEERLSLALEAAKDAVWDWNPGTGRVFFSPQWYNLLGYEPGDKPSVYSTWKELVPRGRYPGSRAGYPQGPADRGRLRVRNPDADEFGRVEMDFVAGHGGGVRERRAAGGRYPLGHP